ncbi:MAG: phosphate acyltransferase PlsX [Phycisphaerales bacterium]
MRLAIDVLGGDHAPDVVLNGGLDALSLLDPADQIVWVGPQDMIRDFLDERGIRDPRISIEHATQNIEMHEQPAKAVRQKPDSTIVRMARLGSQKAPHERRADAVMSAGNTGACVSAAIMQMKRLPGVHRPGIAVTIPTFAGPLVLIDAGSNPEPRPTHLWQYGIMADTYARHVLGIPNPRIAQMNIGTEEEKGTDLIRQTRDLLKVTPGLNYIGYIEGRDFANGVADVIVTDGFVGNTLLKMAEGLVKTVFNAIAHQVLITDPELALRLEPVVKQIYAKTDYHEHGGAPLLGVNGGFIIAHGSSNRRSIKAAIRRAREFVRSGVNHAIVQRLAEVEQQMGAVADAEEAP